MRKLLLPFSLALCCSSPFSLYAAQIETPKLQLAKLYQQNAQLEDYWVSEKLDGVRAFWDGHQLITRQGNVIHAPAWFVAPLPNLPLDGELWIERNHFSILSGIIRKQTPVESEWRQVKYMLFDQPNNRQVFNQRLSTLENLCKQLDRPFIQLIKHFHVSSEAELNAKLQQVIVNGGEGLMLHRGQSRYLAQRNDDLLKLKPFEDAEARVVAYLPGKGQFNGMLGSLLVESEDGQQFKIGTGFTLDERRDPPAIGALVTYRFRGRTHHGLPRFASYLRQRDDF